MIVVVAALKGGVGKTTTSVYLSALAAGGKRAALLVDADPQASAADWIENSEDEHLEWVSLEEAPTERLLSKALDRIKGDDEVAVVDTPPGHEQLLAKALDRADAVVVPTRVGGVETPRVEAVLGMVPRRVPVGLVICSARPYTRDYQEVLAGWRDTCDQRMAIEVGIAVLAAERAQPAMVDALEDLVMTIDDLLDDFTAYRPLDVRFHVGLAELTGSPQLVKQMTETQGAMSALISHIAHPPEVLDSANDQHRRLVAALRRHDESAAARVMTEHLRGTEHVLAGLLPPG
jgi:chromosome partitioning protein